jgi:hypothetical protein
MTESPVDPAHDDHGEDPDETSDQDAEPPVPLGDPPGPALSGQEHPDPLPGADGT